jgi:hypothetical protein
MESSPIYLPTAYFSTERRAEQNRFGRAADQKARPLRKSKIRTMASPVTSPPPSLLIAHGIAIVLMGFIIQGFLSFKDISRELVLYRVYHRDPINQLIHFFGVPAIICSLLVFLAHLNMPKLNFTITIPFVKKHRFNYATVATLIYISCYLSLDLYGGLLYFPVAYMEYAIANNLAVGDQENARSAEKSKKASGKLDSLSWTGT